MFSPVVFILGPTATGKSQLALKLAQKFAGAILNCDSLQTYQRLDIGTAKPPVAERQIVPHFFFDEVKVGDVLTAGDFRRIALSHLAAQLPKQMMFAVGGSGFYIQALEKGMFEVAKPSVEAERAVRAKLDERGPEFMYKELERLDPEYAAELSPNDTYRVTRALIVIADSGRKMSDLRKNFVPQKFPYRYIKLGLSLDREELLPRVRARTQKMLQDGLLAEVEKLLSDGLGDWPPLQSVGYKECVEHLRGRLPREQLEAQIVEKTMQLAKKQRTWFKRDAEIHWLNNSQALSEAESHVARLLSAFDPA